jgi:PAS domain S-box-containing protein
MPQKTRDPAIPNPAVGPAGDVTEVRRKTAALPKAILNSANVLSIATDEQGLIQFFSVGAERMLGYAAPEVLCKVRATGLCDPQEVEARAKALSLELATSISPGFEALVAKASGGIEDSYELTFIRKDGSRFPVFVSVTALRDDPGAIIGYLLVGIDSSPRKLVEEQLRRAEESFRLMVDSVTDCALVMLDTHGRVASWNSGAQRINGYRADEIVGQHFSRFFPREEVDRGLPQRDLTVAADNGRFEDEGWRLRKDGSSFRANVVYTAVRNPNGSMRGFAMLTRDLTERRVVETELKDARLVAERASLAKSEFLSSLSHELRSPLNAILGFAQLLESDSPPPRPGQSENIAQILQEGWHLLKLVDEILDLAKVESRQISLSREPVSLAEVLQECRTSIEPQAQQRGIQVTFPRFDAPCFVRADRNRLKQVLLTLLSNAIKYNIKRGRVEVTWTERASQRIRVSVTDTGAGLNPEQVAHLFQAFNRLGQEAGGEEGTGIGLVMAKQLLELMGGAIGVESTVGLGSVFWFELISVAETRLSTEEGVTEASIPPQGAHPTVLHTLLYVEDNPANLALVEQIVARRPDLRLLTAVNGSSGIEMARNSVPDVILMDINLPGMDGFEVLKVLRSGPATAHIPVVALSANAMPGDVERGLQAGFFRYITKPIRVNEFMEALGVALELAGQQAARDK